MKRAKVVLIALFILILSVAAALTAQTPTPPPQPLDGPGGKQQTNQLVIKNKYGAREKEYWIFEPDSPKPASAPLVIFMHGWGGMNPLFYGAWIDHLVKRGNIVVYPRYQATLLTGREDFLPNSVAAIRDAINRLQTEPGHVRPDLNRVAVVGHSLGGLLAANIAAVAHQEKLPLMRAVMSVEPGLTRRPASVPLADLKKIPSNTLLLSVAGDRDTLVDDEDAKRIFYESTQVTLANKDFVKLVSDEHGRPGLIASHRAPTSPDRNYDDGGSERVSERMNGSQIGGTTASPGQLPEVNALDYFGIWKLFDGLTDAAFFNKNRDFALGNTAAQRFMGKWSDGVPVKEMIVTDHQ